MNRIGRQVEHRRRRRGDRPFKRCPTAIRCAPRSSRWRLEDSASPPSISSRRRPADQDGAGGKPGEGGQLPPQVDATSARATRPPRGLISRATPGHLLIEDLAQLIHDSRTQPARGVSVKLVSEVGVGTVAAGVSKARPTTDDLRFEGGTGFGRSPPHPGRIAVGDRARRDAADLVSRPARAYRSAVDGGCAPGATSRSERCSARTSSDSRRHR